MSVRKLDVHSVGQTAPPELASVFEMLLTRYRFDADGTGQREVVAKIRILNQMGALQRSEEVFEYRPFSEELRIPYVRVRKKDGTVLKVVTDVTQHPPKKVAPQFDLDERRVRIPGLVPGDFVEYDVVTVIHRPLAAGEFYVHHNFDRSDRTNEQLVVDIPRGRNVKVRSPPGVDFWKTDDSTRQVYHWKNVNREPGQIYSIPFVPGRTPDVQLSSFLSWEEFGEWYSELEKNRRAVTPEVKAKADELTQGLNSDIEIVEALYNFAAKKIRYISLASLGIGGYEPRFAEETLHNGYGDCKDKTALLRALLEAKGLHASSALISADREFDSAVPSPWPFNHVITMLKLGKQEIWMDPSAAVLPFQMLDYRLRNKRTLLISPDREPYFGKTPTEAPVPNTWLAEIEGKVNERGTLNAAVTITARGDAELPLRQTFLASNAASLSWAVRGVMDGINRQDEVTDVKINDPTITNVPFTLSFKISKPFFIHVWERHSAVALPFSDLHLRSTRARGLPDLESPVPTELPGEYSYKLRVEFVHRFTLEAPPPLTLDLDFASYKSSYEMDHESLSAIRRLVIRNDWSRSAPADDLSVFRESVVAEVERRIPVLVDLSSPSKRE
jgi:hypothetical protein